MDIECYVTDEILKAGYIASIESPLIHSYMGFITFKEFKIKVKKFDVWGIVDDKPVGIIFFDGNCIHISILKEYFGRCGFVIKKALRLGIKKYGQLIGLVDKTDTKAINFNIRLGFIKIGETNDFIFYHLKGQS